MHHPDALYRERAETIGSSSHCRSSPEGDNYPTISSRLDRHVIRAHANIWEYEVVAVGACCLQDQLDGGSEIACSGPGHAADGHIDDAIAQRLGERLHAGIENYARVSSGSGTSQNGAVARSRRITVGDHVAIRSVQKRSAQIDSASGSRR